MATIQSKKSRGHKYWYIVESKRVNGKPRPIVLAYLGKADDLIKRLNEGRGHEVIKSYSHGAVAALLKVVEELGIVEIINRHVKSQRGYMARKPVRNGLTVGMSMVLGAMGRVSMLQSKRGWWGWAKTTTLECLLRKKLDKVDSQHYWDTMDALPEEAIEKIEEEVLKKMKERYGINSETLLFDMTNFYTYIDSGNERCKIAQRGHNKQKRYDLRQIGLALVVNREDYLGLFHETYRGNIYDSAIFYSVIRKICRRMKRLKMKVDKHTIVFDRGCNSLKNFDLVKKLKFHYVGALRPEDHKKITKEMHEKMREEQIDGQTVKMYRQEYNLWEDRRTVVGFISETMNEKYILTLERRIQKIKKQLAEIQKHLRTTKYRNWQPEKIEKRIEKIIQSDRQIQGLIEYQFKQVNAGRYILTYRIAQQKFKTLKPSLGFRLLVTSRHEWTTDKIMKAYTGQAFVELAFKNMKNPYHLAVRPQFHWTDQKIRIHYFMCVLGYQLASILWKEARKKLLFKGSLNTLLDALCNIRLATVLEPTPHRRGRWRTHYQLEHMTEFENQLMKVFNIEDIHNHPPRLVGVGVYK